jgi:MoxR-like ATPase
LAGFAHNRRVMVQGYHGTGKSSHIEQVAARLNWPCIRINLDAHISRIDLIGRDAIVLKRRPAGHRIPRRPAPLGAADADRAGLRRI